MRLNLIILRYDREQILLPFSLSNKTSPSLRILAGPDLISGDPETLVTRYRALLCRLRIHLN